MELVRQQQFSLVTVWANILLLLPLSLGACPPWTTGNNCTCGDSLGGVVRCDNGTRRTSLLFCYCMTYSNVTEEIYVGSCLAMCQIREYDDKCIAFNMISTTSVENLTKETCGSLKRTGNLCGACMTNYGPPVYSYSLGCTECRESEFWFNLVKYICIAFLPLTAFYIVIMLFKISALSDSMAAYVFTCQVVTMPATTRLLINSASGGFLKVAKILLTMFSIWNLDMFRSLYPPFCLHPKLNTMHVIALDYVVALYPMFLIVITYAAVALHDRYPLIVAAWRPMQRILTCIRKEWNIRGSLVQALGTFLVLSYVKILNVSFDLLTPVNLYDINGNHTTHLFNDGEITYFSKEHYPFAILATAMLITFNISPVIVLLAYPCHCCPKVTRYINKSEIIATFLNAFQGCYRIKPKICRHYSAVYFIARFLLLLTFAIIHDFTYIPMTGFYFLLLCILVTFTRPYKNDKYNDVDGLFFLLYGFCYFLLLTHMYIMVYEPEDNKSGSLTALACLVSIPILYGTWVLLRLVLPQVVWNRLKLLHSKAFARRAREQPSAEEYIFPDRLEYEDEYTPLLRSVTD